VKLLMLHWRDFSAKEQNFRIVVRLHTHAHTV